VCGVGGWGGAPPPKPPTPQPQTPNPQSPILNIKLKNNYFIKNKNNNKYFYEI